jgi:histidine triad (HIT) family protein
VEENCLFCKIIKKEISAHIIYENDYIIAFEDIHPAAPVHYLVVPKKHIVDTNSIEEADGIYIIEVFKGIKEVAKILNIAENGYRVICNCGEDGGQVVHHIHFHLLGGKRLGPKIVNI